MSLVMRTSWGRLQLVAFKRVDRLSLPGVLSLRLQGPHRARQEEFQGESFLSAGRKTSESSSCDGLKKRSTETFCSRDVNYLASKAAFSFG